jgi:hypothetical protein
MLESVLPILQGLITSAKAMASFDSFRKKSKGEARALIQELKENSRLCFRVVVDDVPHKEVIPLFSTAVFDRLNQEGFNFNALKRSAIPGFPEIERTDLASWPGKHTAELIENIYDKIKDLRSRHTFIPDGSLHKRRIVNIHKRILLLLRHAKS